MKTTVKVSIFDRWDVRHLLNVMIDIGMDLSFTESKEWFTREFVIEGAKEDVLIADIYLKVQYKLECSHEY